MAKEIIMPKFGFTQEESEILEWLKNEGETVEKGDPIATVSIDKLSMEVEAPEDGILSGIRFKVGDVVPVTKIIAYILQPGEELPETDEPVVPAAAVEEPAEKELKVSATPVAKSMMKDAGLDSATIQGTGTDGKITKADVQKAIEAAAAKPSGKVAATPAAKRVAGERTVDLSTVVGSGPSGRVQEADVLKASVSKPVFTQAVTSLEEKHIPLRGMRRIIAENMASSMREAPHMTLQMEVDMSAATALRATKAAVDEVSGKKFTYTAMITKFVSIALANHPKFNSRFGEEEIVILPDVNIGVAVAMDAGLIVPVIKDVLSKGIKQISNEIRDVASRARSNALQPNDLEGGTFTISNLGMYGVDSFTAIINPPQAAILAVGRISERFVPDENKNPVLKPMMSLTLNADHRIVDGAEAAEFLAEIKYYLENPGVLIL